MTIHELSVVERHQDEITVDVHCTKGTYVRSLAEDIGMELGCGAHVIELRRLAAGPYRVDEAVSMKQLEALAEDKAQLDAKLQPVSSAVQDWPQVELTDIRHPILGRGSQFRLRMHRPQGW